MPPTFIGVVRSRRLDSSFEEHILPRSPAQHSDIVGTGSCRIRTACKHPIVAGAVGAVEVVERSVTVVAVDVAYEGGRLCLKEWTSVLKLERDFQHQSISDLDISGKLLTKKECRKSQEVKAIAEFGAEVFRMTEAQGKSMSRSTIGLWLSWSPSVVPFSNN